MLSSGRSGEASGRQCTQNWAPPFTSCCEFPCGSQTANPASHICGKGTDSELQLQGLKLCALAFIQVRSACMNIFM